MDIQQIPPNQIPPSQLTITKLTMTPKVEMTMISATYMIHMIHTKIYFW